MRKRQAGIFLVGATIAVAVVGILLTLWMNQRMQEMRIQKAENVAVALKTIGDGVQSFIVQYHDDIDKALQGSNAVPLKDAGSLGNVELTAVSGMGGRELRVNAGGGPIPPSAGVIVQIMQLPGVGDKPPLPDASYVIRIYRESNNANIRALVHLDKPFRKTYDNAPDWNMLGTAVRKIGVNGGLSQDDKGQFTFPLTPSGNPQVRNTLPDSSNTPGLLAIRAGYLLDPLNRYLRRDGSEAMTGNLNMGQQNIVGVAEISGNADALKINGKVDITKRLLVGPGAASRANAAALQNSDDWIIAGKGIASGNLLAGTSAEMQKDLRSKDGVVAATTGIWSYGELWAKNNIYNRDGDLSIRGMPGRGNINATGDISADRDVSAAGVVKGSSFTTNGADRSRLDADSLTLGNAIAVPNASCSPNNKIARDNSGMFYVCQNRRWATLKGDLGPQGPQGYGGPRGPQGPTGKDAKINFSTTQYDVNQCDWDYTTRKSIDAHNFCWVSRVNSYECKGGMNFQYTVASVTPADKPAGATDLNVGAFWLRRQYAATTRQIFALTTMNTHASMTCIDFN